MGIFSIFSGPVNDVKQAANAVGNGAEKAAGAVGSGVKQAAYAVDDKVTSIATPPVLHPGELGGAKWVMDAKRGAIPKQMQGKDGAVEAVRHAPEGAKRVPVGEAGAGGTIAEAAQRVSNAVNVMRASEKYAVPGPRVGDAAGAPKPLTPMTSIEKNSLMHCVGNVAAETVTGAFTGGVGLGKACKSFPLTAPFTPNCASAGAALGGAAGANHALQTPACQKAFGQQPPL